MTSRMHLFKELEEEQGKEKLSKEKNFTRSMRKNWWEKVKEVSEHIYSIRNWSGLSKI